jgi:hypothetical protein
MNMPSLEHIRLEKERRERPGRFIVANGPSGTVYFELIPPGTQLAVKPQVGGPHE